MGPITQLIRAAGNGDRAALDQVFDLLYRELHDLAHARLSAHATSTLLDTTSLVHETYLRLLKAGEIEIADRRHFFAYAARAMRSIVVDFARRKNAEQRGGDLARVTIPPDLASRGEAGGEEILRVHEALERLSGIDPDLTRLVEMRYFAGLQVGEIAEAFGVTERTIERQWHKARAILFATLR